MRYEQFLDEVSQRAQLARPQAEAVGQATLQAIAEQVPAAEIEELLAELPTELRQAIPTGTELRPHTTRTGFNVRVGELAGVSPAEAEQHAQVVFSALAEALGAGRLDQLLQRLPGEYRDLVPDEGEVSQHVAFFDRVRQRAHLDSKEDASRIAHATLTVLGERLSGGQADDLSPSLPIELRRHLSTGSGQATAFDRASFLDAVSGHTGSVDLDDTERHVRAVLATVRDWAPRSEIDDTLAQMPRELAALFR